jgi:hypothetical protein
MQKFPKIKKLTLLPWDGYGNQYSDDDNMELNMSKFSADTMTKFTGYIVPMNFIDVDGPLSLNLITSFVRHMLEATCGDNLVVELIYFYDNYDNHDRYSSGLTIKKPPRVYDFSESYGKSIGDTNKTVSTGNFKISMDEDEQDNEPAAAPEFPHTSFLNQCGYYVKELYFLWGDTYQDFDTCHALEQVLSQCPLLETLALNTLNLIQNGSTTTIFTVNKYIKKMFISAFYDGSADDLNNLYRLCDSLPSLEYLYIDNGPTDRLKKSIKINIENNRLKNLIWEDYHSLHRRSNKENIKNIPVKSLLDVDRVTGRRKTLLCY